MSSPQWQVEYFRNEFLSTSPELQIVFADLDTGNLSICMTTSFRTSMHVCVLGMIVAVAMFASAASAHAQTMTTGSISSQLSFGSRGADVARLQTLLASNHDIYPRGLVTGYYGPLTRAAVVQFQLAYGISPVGRVGPVTLKKLNSILAMSDPTLDIYAPIISGVGVSFDTGSPTLVWTTNEPARGKVYFDTTPLVGRETTRPMTEPYTSGMVVVENSFDTNHAVALNNLTPGKTYYCIVESSDAAGNVSVTSQAKFAMASTSSNL
ncbi:MAG TPA: peptidoglycan-binding domain-containing protein [Candidatus Paceibacterota bacterium]